ncbi:MAG: hypothetical protein JW904_11910 [Spirochaetales bacterium]|nr:hypothetical protein [Spirochaetales bacterium]
MYLLSSGAWDLTSRIYLLHFDEIGELCVAVNKIIGFLGSLIGKVSASVK